MLWGCPVAATVYAKYIYWQQPWPGEVQAYKAGACLGTLRGSSKVVGSEEEFFLQSARQIAVHAYCGQLCMHTARMATRHGSG